jgi:hypothetical protein
MSDSQTTEANHDEERNRPCTIERTDGRLTVSGSIETVPPNWTRAILYGVGVLCIGIPVVYLGYPIFVLGEPTGFGLDSAIRARHVAEDDTWGGVLLAAVTLSALMSGLCLFAVILAVKKIPGLVQPLDYRLTLDDNEARVERRVGAQQGKLVETATMSTDAIAQVERRKQSFGLVPVVALVGREGQVLTFGKYIKKTALRNVLKSSTPDDPDRSRRGHRLGDSEIDRVVHAVDAFLSQDPRR